MYIDWPTATKIPTNQFKLYENRPQCINVVCKEGLMSNANFQQANPNDLSNENDNQFKLIFPRPFSFEADLLSVTILYSEK